MVTAGQGGDPPAVKIGVLPTLYRGERPELAAAIKNPLLDEIESETGLDCELELALTAASMRQKLTDGELQFGFCHGYEFAWMQAKEPRLKPLMLAMASSRPIKVYLVVADSSSAKSPCDLAGKVLAIPKGIDPAVYLFAKYKCKCGDKVPSDYVKQVTTPENSEMALHAVFEDKVQAAFVDTAAMQSFAERFPARSKKLRTLVESKPFPLSVVAYCDGRVAPSIVKRFQETMAKARANRSSRLLMALMHCDGFELVPVSYAKDTAEFLKDYPREAVD
jgi:ABC-type phosphate/phosphonate transport system substrate-binding protein